jgi:uncharacterized membrane protein
VRRVLNNSIPAVYYLQQIAFSAESIATSTVRSGQSEVLICSEMSSFVSKYRKCRAGDLTARQKNVKWAIYIYI